jgi:hypothetical protein
MRTRLSASLTGRGLSATALTAVNSVVFNPMPSASVSTAMAVKPGLRASIRPAYRRSLNRVSIRGRPRRSRLLSLSWVTPPRASRAERFASSRAMPRRMFSSVSISRWPCTSWSKSASKRLRENIAWIREARTLNQVNMASTFVRHIEQTADYAGDPFPVAGLRGELFATGFGDRIEFGLAIVVRNAPLRRDPSLLP